MDKYMEKVEAYRKAMSVAAELLRRGIIDAKDYNAIEEKITNKYGINSCSIYRKLS